jgi:UDP-N-acetylmuramate dehydrogenase
MHRRLVELSKLDVGLCTFAVPLKECGWWRIGGPADLLVEPGSGEQLQTLLSALKRLDLTHVIIGDGSNILFDDKGFRGVVIRIGRRMSSVAVQGTDVVAGAGCFVPRLVSRLGRSGLSGLEHAVGIPGTLGGLVSMNGGSQRKSIGSNIVMVWTVDAIGVVKQYSREECQFAYRKSAFQQNNEVIYMVRLSLNVGNKDDIRTEMLGVLRSRRNKFPLKLPNCGSVFVSNPEMYDSVGPPGEVIEKCGLKGFRVGGAMVSEDHANFIVNIENASSVDVLKLIEHVNRRVFEKYGCLLKTEIKYICAEGGHFDATKLD